MKINKLNKSDLQQWKSPRIEALLNAPQAFGGSFEEESLKSDSYFENLLMQTAIFGAFSGNELVGCVGLSKGSSLKTKHIGDVYTVYIKPGYRSQGIAKKLMEHLIEHAQKDLIYLRLKVTNQKKDDAALKLYEQLGFQSIGIEHEYLKVGEEFYDATLMTLSLKQES
mgnify:CR=1 FL=1